MSGPILCIHGNPAEVGYPPCPKCCRNGERWRRRFARNVAERIGRGMESGMDKQTSLRAVIECAVLAEFAARVKRHAGKEGAK